MARKHDHVERLVADGAVLVDQPLEAQSGGTDWTDELTAMHFEELWNLALGIDDAIVRQMVECIKVYPGGKLEIIFGGGYLVEESV